MISIVCEQWLLYWVLHMCDVRVHLIMEFIRSYIYAEFFRRSVMHTSRVKGDLTSGQRILVRHVHGLGTVRRRRSTFLYRKIIQGLWSSHIKVKKNKRNTIGTAARARNFICIRFERNVFFCGIYLHDLVFISIVICILYTFPGHFRRESRIARLFLTNWFDWDLLIAFLCQPNKNKKSYRKICCFM